MADDVAIKREDRVTGSQNYRDSSVIFDEEISFQSLSLVNISNAQSRTGKPLFVASTKETCFSHLNSSTMYPKHLEILQKQAANFVEMKITQECLKRLVSIKNFTKKLQIYAEHECSRLDAIHRQESSKNRGLCLDYYNKLCKDAIKLHFNHWELLESKVRRHYGSFSKSLAVVKRIEKFKMSFFSLRRQVLFWLRVIALVGLRTMANASFKQLSSTSDVQNFLQGVEAFNHIFTSCLRMCTQRQELFGGPDKQACLNHFFHHSLFSLNIVEILATVCVERAHLLARLTHEHFTREAKAIELQDFLSITRFSWTFDKHLSTSDLRECTANVGYGKLQSVIRKYVHKDEEFIKQLLDTASVCAYLHHEKEGRRSNSVCEQHKMLTNCECMPALKCWTCQENESSIKAITIGTDCLNYLIPHSAQTNEDRRTLFMESPETSLKTQLFMIYSNDLWERFALQFFNSLQKLQWPYSKGVLIGSVCCWSTAVLMGITQHLDNLASTGPFSSVGAQSVRIVSRSLYLNSVIASLDGLHCLMLAIGQSDKCKCTNIVDSVPSTKTTNLMVQACSVFLHFFSTASYWKELKPEETISLPCRTGRTLSIRVEDIFDRFSAFLDYSIFWFTTKTKQFLASWNLSAFLLLSKYELRVLMKSINTTLQSMEGMLCEPGHAWTDDMKDHWDEMERKAGFLQLIEAESWENFKQKFITIASEFWQEMMPKGRIWKRSRNSGNLPSEPSSYVEHAIVQVLQPVIEGVKQLPVRLQNYILIQAVEIMMDTWSSHILKEEIKFSVIGAYQLQVDFNYVKLWLTSETSALCASVQSDLAILDVFRQLNEAVHLLMIQPKKKLLPGTRNGVQQDMASNSSTVSGSSVLSTNSSYDGELELLGPRLIPNKEQWLNLRLRKGKPRMPMVIPACLKSAEHA